MWPSNSRCVEDKCRGLPSKALKNPVSCTGWTRQQSDQENRPHMVCKWIWFVPLAFENVGSTSGDFVQESGVLVEGWEILIPAGNSEGG